MTDETAPVTVTATEAAQSILTAKNGWKTTEFWIALAMLLVGCWLVEKGQDTLGGALVLASGMGYTASRTAVKRAVRVSVVMLALMLNGCHSTCLEPSNVGPCMIDALDRHDAYVGADTKLSKDEREVYADTSTLLRHALYEAGFVDPEGRAYYVPENKE